MSNFMKTENNCDHYRGKTYILHEYTIFYIYIIYRLEKPENIGLGAVNIVCGPESGCHHDEYSNSSFFPKRTR